MDIVYALRKATANEIHEKLSDPPTFSATRAVIRTLEEKGHIRHQEQGLRYIYLPTIPLESASQSAVAHLLATFFGGSRTQLLAALLGDVRDEVAPEELQQLEELVRKAKESSK